MSLLNYCQAIETYGSDLQLKKTLREGRLFKVGAGVYSTEKNPPMAAVVCFEYPSAIITMLSAFYFHGLTDAVPEKIDIAIPSSGRRPNGTELNVYYSPKHFHDAGVMVTQKHGYPFRVYGKERMLIELLRNKTSLPYDLYKEVLSHYRNMVEELDIRAIEDMLVGFPKASLILKRLEDEVL